MKTITDKYKDMLLVAADNNELERIRSFVAYNAMEFGFDEITTNKISLAVDEVCSNLIRHAYNYDSDEKICITIDNVGREFIIKIYDNAKSFNPILSPTPDMNDYFEHYKRGGLGIHIIKLVMDEISYQSNNDKSMSNVLCLKKYLN